MIAERDAQIFNFYLNGSVREGLRHRHKLYGKVYSFSREDRDAALNLAIELGEMDNQTMITVSYSSYRVWVELRSSEYPYWNIMNDAAPGLRSTIVAARQGSVAACESTIAS